MARKRCNRALRDEGFQAIPRTCAICGLGPCSRLVVGENFPQPVAHIPYGDGYATVDVPNRLYGTTINHEGDAV